MFFSMLICLSLYPLFGNGCFYNMIRSPVAMSEESPPHEFGKPLYLTPIMESGDVDRARHISKVGILPNSTAQVDSYSGFLTVNKRMGSHLFFWFFPAMNKDHSAPIIVWLQGGPGLSSMIGVFVEHGPYEYDYHKEMVRLRNTTWADTLNVLYIDNPVGTGFSFTSTEDGYATNHTTVAHDLMEALTQFFTIFHRYKGNNIYLAGEGYGCKYVISLAHLLHTSDGGPHQLELKGVSVGNGICDPSMLVNHTNFLYYTGLIDKRQAETYRNHSASVEGYIKRRQEDSATKELNAMFLDQASRTSYIRRITGMENIYDIRHSKLSSKLYLYTKYLATAPVRKALHVGMTPFNNHKKVCSHLKYDWMLPVKNYFEPILNNYKVLLYHGHLDALVPYTTFMRMLQKLSWKRSNEKPKRMIWKRQTKSGDVLAGYVQTIGDLSQVMVWKAGHFVPMAAPEAAHDMFTRFIWGKSFH